MKLDKAIEVLISGSELSRPWLLGGYEEALKLGIEAMKRLQEGRQKGYDFFAHLLPGETE